jgi:hypothetical protein
VPITGHFPALMRRISKVCMKGLIVAPRLRVNQSEKEVAPMIKKLQKLLSPSRRRRSSRRQFNRLLLEKQREDVFLLMHQQLGGMM